MHFSTSKLTLSLFPSLCLNKHTCNLTELNKVAFLCFTLVKMVWKKKSFSFVFVCGPSSSLKVTQHHFNNAEVWTLDHYSCFFFSSVSADSLEFGIIMIQYQPSVGCQTITRCPGPAVAKQTQIITCQQPCFTTGMGCLWWDAVFGFQSFILWIMSVRLHFGVIWPENIIPKGLVCWKLEPEKAGVNIRHANLQWTVWGESVLNVFPLQSRLSSMQTSTNCCSRRFSFPYFRMWKRPDFFLITEIVKRRNWN